MRSQDFYSALVQQALNVNRMKRDEVAHLFPNDWRFLRDFGTVTLNLGQRSGTTTWIAKRVMDDVQSCALVGSFAGLKNMCAYGGTRNVYGYPHLDMLNFKLVMVDQGSAQLGNSATAELQKMLGQKDSKVEQLLVLGG